MGIQDGFVQFSAGTAPQFRRRGVQTALLGARVADATSAGCELALVTVQPGSRSQRNVQRRGFDLLYTRATLISTTPAGRSFTSPERVTQSKTEQGTTHIQSTS